MSDDLLAALVDEIRRFRIERHQRECVNCPGEAYCETWPVDTEAIEATP